MDHNQKQALANYFHALGGGEFTLDAALAFAASLSPGGRLGTENFWREILRHDDGQEAAPTGATALIKG